MKTSNKYCSASSLPVAAKYLIEWIYQKLFTNPLSLDT